MAHCIHSMAADGGDNSECPSMLMTMTDPLELLQKLVGIPAPPGQEELLSEFLITWLDSKGIAAKVDPKGNVVVNFGDPSKAEVVVTAHMDEVALMVTGITPDGRLSVTNLGGIYPWKWGEGLVEILAKKTIPGVLSFGSVHTDSSDSTAALGRTQPLEWGHATVFTGMAKKALENLGVGPGSRVVIARERRRVTEIGQHISSYFLDDRADLAAWLLLIEQEAARKKERSIVYAATASEEVGGEGALYLLHRYVPRVCVALELGPVVPDSDIELTATPTFWVKDSFAAATAKDLEIVSGLGQSVQFQYLSRGGSDASCAASHGLCARPATFGIPMDNTHGYEIIHRDSIGALVDLVAAYLNKVI